MVLQSLSSTERTSDEVQYFCLFPTLSSMFQMRFSTLHDSLSLERGMYFMQECLIVWYHVIVTAEEAAALKDLLYPYCIKDSYMCIWYTPICVSGNTNNEFVRLFMTNSLKFTLTLCKHLWAVT